MFLPAMCEAVISTSRTFACSQTLSCAFACTVSVAGGTFGCAEDVRQWALWPPQSSGLHSVSCFFLVYFWYMDVSLSLCLGVLTYLPLALPVLHWCELAWFLLLYHIPLYKWPHRPHRLQDPFTALPPGNIWVIKGCRKWQQSQCAHHLPFLGVQQWCCGASLPYLELCRRVGSLRSRMSVVKMQFYKMASAPDIPLCGEGKGRLPVRRHQPHVCYRTHLGGSPQVLLEESPGAVTPLGCSQAQTCSCLQFCSLLYLGAGEAHSQLSGWGEGPW